MVVIRLARYGKKKKPFYKIMVADKRKSCNGKFLKKIGFFNPFLIKNNRYYLNFNVKIFEYWLKKGALPTNRVKYLFKLYKTYI